MHDSERFVRDLLWAVNSPSLMNLTHESSASTRPLKESDIDPEHLRAHLTKHPEQAVGRYFERLIVYWVRFIRGCEIVAHSLQLIEGKQTVGEIDLLFRDEQDRLTHWEVACKFYLQVDVGTVPTTDYIGPNSKDTLWKKATRMTQHQLPLGIRHFPEIQMQEAFVKGRIFHHGRSGSNASLPAELAVDHLQGHWIWEREVSVILGADHSRYRILRKPFWLSDELATSPDDDLLNADHTRQTLNLHFRERATPVLVSAFRQGTFPASESQRWFVVPNHWPNQP